MAQQHLSILIHFISSRIDELELAYLEEKNGTSRESKRALVNIKNVLKVNFNLYKILTGEDYQSRINIYEENKNKLLHP